MTILGRILVCDMIVEQQSWNEDAANGPVRVATMSAHVRDLRHEYKLISRNKHEMHTAPHNEEDATLLSSTQK